MARAPTAPCDPCNLIRWRETEGRSHTRHIGWRLVPVGRVGAGRHCERENPLRPRPSHLRADSPAVRLLRERSYNSTAAFSGRGNVRALVAVTHKDDRLALQCD